ncbi:choline dehydrogenase [Corticibacter populi]|uniref:Choline dehydrogenase n=1 Tax=Corticibacter populi TaxID=1550736 RepID=A0A3M6QRU1_9BURK|nr:GMC family oxidoreductase N-terminal domain-containing protein [Corticibacter populi]RMX05765.1 choline dehydrogenase [Corticibacter populi]RZS30931.1 choline dehydrogenase [Corticibacter populi]
MSDTSAGPQFDYVIVGAGTAGALLANRLSANAHRRVLLVEAGRRDDYLWIHLPGGQPHCLGNPRTDWRYASGSSGAIHAGKGLGGSSSIGRMLYLRGDASDYARWAALTGDDGWRWEHVLPFFMQHEDHDGPANAWHARQTEAQRLRHKTRAAPQPQALDYAAALAHRHAGGEWKVQAAHDPAGATLPAMPQLRAVLGAAEQAGLPRIGDFNRGRLHGVGLFALNQHRGLRWNSARAFLRPACYGRPNVEIWNGAHAAELCFDDAMQPLRCTGVAVWTGQEMLQVRASREVILCAGALQTPLLLQRSGIGPARLLAQHQIAPRVDLPAVGAHLQDHWLVPLHYQLHGGAGADGAAAPRRHANDAHTHRPARLRWQDATRFALQRQGPWSCAPTPLGGFACSAASAGPADIGFLVSPLPPPSVDPGGPDGARPSLTFHAHALHPTSRGSVAITGRAHDAAPRISLDGPASPEDRRLTAAAIQLVQRMARQPALQAWRPCWQSSADARNTDVDAATHAGILPDTLAATARGAGHLVGSARMGAASDVDAALDLRLRVRGTQGLRVVDASAMPVLTGGGTAAAVLMMAEKAAAWIAAEADGQGPPPIR